MDYDNLVTWSDLQRKIDAGEQLDPVEQFIYDEESASPHDADWRKRFQAALYFFGGAPRKSEESAPSTSSNIDYTAALEKELSTVLLKEWNCAMKEQVHELATRLNSVVKAQQNCA